MEGFYADITRKPHLRNRGRSGSDSDARRQRARPYVLRCLVLHHTKCFVRYEHARLLHRWQAGFAKPPHPSRSVRRLPPASV